MKNPTTLFIFFVCLSLSTLISACGPLTSAPDRAGGASGPVPATSVSPARLSPQVRIEHTWIEHKDGAPYFLTEFGLGTAVEPNVILTHNHFHLQPKARENEAFTLKTPAGQEFTVSMSDLTLRPIDAGTLIIYLPHYVSLGAAALGDQTTLNQLAAGDWLQVDYWDEIDQCFVQGKFQIRRLEQGVATLADPHLVIRTGDSGGGIYLAGKLIGNTWARYVDPTDGRPIGEFNVALLPAGAMALLQPEQRSIAAAIPANTIAAVGDRSN
jgi:hypothetical protein